MRIARFVRPPRKVVVRASDSCPNINRPCDHTVFQPRRKSNKLNFKRTPLSGEALLVQKRIDSLGYRRDDIRSRLDRAWNLSKISTIVDKDFGVSSSDFLSKTALFRANKKSFRNSCNRRCYDSLANGEGPLLGPPFVGSVFGSVRGYSDKVLEDVFRRDFCDSKMFPLYQDKWYKACKEQDCHPLYKNQPARFFSDRNKNLIPAYEFINSNRGYYPERSEYFVRYRKLRDMLKGLYQARWECGVGMEKLYRILLYSFLPTLSSYLTYPPDRECIRELAEHTEAALRFLRARRGVVSKVLSIPYI